jgi:hypothetical protein
VRRMLNQPPPCPPWLGRRLRSLGHHHLRATQKHSSTAP